MNISIFELVNLMMGEAEERLGDGYVRSEERVSDLKACCSDIANVLNAHNSEGFEVEIDEDDNTVHVALILPSPWDKIS